MCRACFGGSDSSSFPRSSDNHKDITQDQFQILNKKLDAILKALGTAKSIQEKKVEVEIDEEPKPPKKAWAKIKYD